MPPANSPAEAGSPADRSRPSTPASFRSALRELASPVPDYASTLTLQVEDEIEADNISFLRAPFSPTEEEPPPPPPPRDSREVSPQRRLLLQERARALARGETWTEPPPLVSRGVRRVRHSPAGGDTHEAAAERRRHELWAERMSQHTAAPYGDRVPSQQSLYDWAPATEEGEEEELEAILSDLRRQQPNTHPEILRVLARADLDATRDARNRPPSHRSSTSQQEPSLRSAAILQSVRRNWRFSTRSRLLMSRYIMERERATQDVDSTSAPAQPNPSEERTSDATAESNLTRLQRIERRTRQSEESNSTQQDTIETLRRRYLENPSNKSMDFERIIEYLHDQRSLHLADADKRATGAVDSRTRQCPSAAGNRRFWLEMSKLRPHPTSWLAAGTTFTGQQQATSPLTSSTTLYRLANNQSITSTTFQPAVSRNSNLDPSQPWVGQHLTSTPLSFHSTPATPGSTSSGPPPDRWTVKVAIHAIDYDKMTLQGTMEAFNVPSVSSHGLSGLQPNSTSNTSTNGTSNQSNSSSMNGQASNASKTTFSTYLEGEIIDFTTHTLLTEPDHFAVKTTPTVDAAYWRRLEPFAKLSDSEIARALLDRKWIDEQLVSRYVLMRWKERCFVKPTFTSFSNLTPPNASSPASDSRPHTRPHSPHQHRSHQHQHHDDTDAEDDGYEADDADAEDDDAPYRPTPPPPAHSATTSFLSGADGNGYGLSISGFYYVSLRRSDGRCEGLYYDPQSSPYQHLELRPTEGTWGSGSWAFR